MQNATFEDHPSLSSDEPLDLMLVSIHASGSLILMVARDREGTRYTVQVPYEPYFYVPDEEVDEKLQKGIRRVEPGYVSALDERRLTRVYTNSPADVPKKRRGKSHMEANVPYPRRALIDMRIKKGFRLLRYVVVNEEYRVLLAQPADIEPADVDAPMFGYLYDIETQKNPATGKWDAKPPTPKNVNGGITGISFNWCKWTKDGAHPEEEITTIQWQEGVHPGSPRRETHLKYSHAHGKDILWRVITFANEVEMMLDFVGRIKRTLPDILAAWNGHHGFKNKRKPGGTGGFDTPYVINRLDKIGIGSSQLSPFNHVTANYRKRGDGESFYWACEIAGVQLIDLMTTFTIKDGGMTGSVAKSSLKYVVEMKTTMPILKDPASIDTWWKWHNDAFLDYSFQDVDALMILEKKEDYVGYIKRFQWATGTEDANCLFAPSTMIDSLWLRKAREVGVVLPSGGDEEAFLEIDEDERGGHVRPPQKKGILQNVVGHDFSAMYAEILGACNIGRDTIVLDPKDYRDDDIVVPIKDDWSVTVRFRSPTVKKAICAQANVELRALRKVYDDKIEVAKNPAEVKKLKKEREPFKQLLLASWGVMKNSYARLGHTHAGAAIPATGRFLIKSAMAHADDLDCPTNYCDTDGTLTITPEGKDPVQFGFWLQKRFASAVDKAVQRMNVKEHNFEMGFEKVYSWFVMGRSMKRYAGYIVWNEGSYAPPHDPKACRRTAKHPHPADASKGECVHFEMTGFEAVKHDAPPITKELEVKVLRGILDKTPTDRLTSYVRSVYEMVRRGEVPIDEIVKAQRLGFDPTLDKDANSEIVRGARNGRDLFGFDYVIGSRVVVLKAKGTTDVVSIPEDAEIPAGELQIDWDHHASSAVLNPLKAVFEMIDAADSFESIEKGTKQTRQRRLQIVTETPKV